MLDLMKWVSIVSTKFRFFVPQLDMFQLVVLLDLDLFGGYGRFDEMGINCFYEISVLVFWISPTGYVPIGCSTCSTLILTSMVDMLDLMKWVSIVSKNFRFLSFEFLPMDMVQLVVLLDFDLYWWIWAIWWNGFQFLQWNFGFCVLNSPNWICFSW